MQKKKKKNQNNLGFAFKYSRKNVGEKIYEKT